MPPSGSVFSYKPRPLVLCGPSGTGKSTLIKQLLSEFNEYFGFSVSHTTRKPRPGEVDGREYHFTDRETMLKEIENCEFLEHAEFSGNMYGTSKKAVRAVQETGKICILDIDTQGVKLIKKTDLNPHYVFIAPPSLDVLEQRLRDRKTETEESLNRRLSAAKQELEYGEQPGNFDINIINDDLARAYEQLRQFILPEIRQLVSH